MDAPTPTLAPKGTRCVQCGYLVERLDVAKPCPECGRFVADSLKPTVLELLPCSRVTGFMWGAGTYAALAVCAILATVFSAVGSAAMWNAPMNMAGFDNGPSLYRFCYACAQGFEQLKGVDLVVLFLLAGRMRPWSAGGPHLRLLLASVLAAAQVLLKTASVFVIGSTTSTTMFAWTSIGLWLVWLAILATLLVWLTQLGIRARWKPAGWLGPLSLVCMLLYFAASIAQRADRLADPGSAGGTILAVAMILLLLPRVILAVGVWRCLRQIVHQLDR
jgi:hypothetical protein